MPPTYRRYIVLGIVLMVLALGAGIWLLTSVDDAGVAEVPTEQQVLGDLAAAGSGATGAAATTASPATTIGLGAKSGTAGAATTTRAPASASTTTARAAKDANGFTVVRPAQLPKEAQQTLALVDKGGPYPYTRDGIEFQNREKILPKKPAGYYREYTVVTPGSSDRGARRIIAGSGGERYYTADHYESFVRVEAAP